MIRHLKTNAQNVITQKQVVQQVQWLHIELESHEPGFGDYPERRLTFYYA